MELNLFVKCLMIADKTIFYLIIMWQWISVITSSLWFTGRISLVQRNPIYVEALEDTRFDKIHNAIFFRAKEWPHKSNVRKFHECFLLENNLPIFVLSSFGMQFLWLDWIITTRIFVYKYYTSQPRYAELRFMYSEY